MALRVWLPLNGTLENKGLENLTVTNNGATVDASGNTVTETKTERVKDNNVQYKMTAAKSKMSSNTSAMESLRAKIANMI